jgi:cell division protein FtsI/penicillin-binding protein 2
MERKSSRWAVDALFVLLTLFMMALGGRVAQLQTVCAPHLAEQAAKQQRRVIVLPARPGNVFAQTRGGVVLLAGSSQVPSCYADPSLIEEADFQAVARKIAAITGDNPDLLYRKLLDRKSKRFVYLTRDITEAQSDAIDKLNLKGVEITHEWRRHYPNGSLAAHVLGFRQIDGVPAGGGIELQADKWLASTEGLEVLHTDAARKGTMAEMEYYEPPRDGKHVVLTIDVRIQAFLEQALARAYADHGGESVMGTVMDPNTGAVLAMATVPTYDPAHYPLSKADQRRNRVITDPYEPGSAFKPIIASGAIEMGKITLESKFFCYYGTYDSPRGGTIRDFPGEHFGSLPVTEIIVHSSNIGMAKIGEMLGNDLLYRIGNAFGFGQDSGIDLPGECPGILWPARKWNSYSTLRMPFGQGVIVVTNLQLCNAYCTIANGGMLLKPRVIDRVIDSDGQVAYQSQPTKLRRVLSADVARSFIDEALVPVVTRGTAKRCGLDRWQMFGKTGTAQIGGPHGYSERSYTGSFVGAAPAGKPAVVCAISVYKPDYSRGHTGADVAAPYVKEVMEKTLNYMNVPDEIEPGVASAGAARAPTSPGAAAAARLTGATSGAGTGTPTAGAAAGTARTTAATAGTPRPSGAATDAAPRTGAPAGAGGFN